MVVWLVGKALGGTGWHVRVPGAETTLWPLSDTSAWFQMPVVTAGEYALQIYNPNFPISYGVKVQVRALAIWCLGTLHEDFSRLVVPELQRRGLHHLDYKGPTLRENLGLDRPAVGAWRQYVH